MSNTDETKAQTSLTNEPLATPVVPQTGATPPTGVQPSENLQTNTQLSRTANILVNKGPLLCKYLKGSEEKQLDVYLVWYERRWEEIHYRNEVKHKIATAAFITLAALIGAFAQTVTAIPTTIFFVYPLLTLFLSGEWAYFNRQVELNGWFIRRIEKALEPVMGEGWEEFWTERAQNLISDREGSLKTEWRTIRTLPDRWRTIKKLPQLIGARLIDRLRASSIFIGAPLLALLLGLIKSQYTVGHWNFWWPILLCFTSVFCSYCMIVGSELRNEIEADVPIGFLSPTKTEADTSNLIEGGTSSNGQTT